MSKLFEPIDAASLAAFRVLFGSLMCWSTLSYLWDGKVTRYYVDPPFHFKYYGFEWVQPLPELGMLALFVAMAVLAALIAVGLWYRLSAALFCLAFTYCILLEQARYLNHHYLICLLSALLVFIPAHRAWSLDSRRRGFPPLVPACGLWCLRAQIGLVYFYAGIAKINPDWLRGEPLRAWLGDRSALPLLGPLFTREWVVMSASWGTMLLDLLLAPLLLYRPTRVFAFAAAVAFHLANAVLFDIGVFPWMMIAASTLFFSPDWPRRLLGLGGPARLPAPPLGAARGAATEAGPRGHGRAPGLLRPLFAGRRAALVRGLIGALAAAFLLVQALLPLRHWLYPGDVSWNEEGHMFAWHMKLRDKESRIMFLARSPESRRMWRIDPRDELTDWQVGKMAGRPDMILQYAHHLAARLRAAGHGSVEVRADVIVSLNHRPPQRFIDPNVDLARQPRSLLPAPWILPLAEPES